MSDKTKTAKGAEYYATQLGWKIHPCHGVVDGRCTCGNAHGADTHMRGKHPATSHGHKDATSDGATIAGWWVDNPNYNVGVFCKPSGFFVIDIDPRSGGFDSYEKFEELLDWCIPNTVEAQTGIYSQHGKEVRGRHLYFKYTGDEKLIGNLKEEKLPGIDIKHEGYVLCPPSMHFSGAEYSWKPGHAPWEMEMAEAPEQLLNALIKRSRALSRKTSYMSKLDPSALDELSEIPGSAFDFNAFKERGEKITEGSRAQDIFKIACSVANKFDMSSELGRQAVETWMARFNYEWVEPPLGMGELAMHVSNAIKFVHENPKKSYIPEIEDWQRDAVQRIQDNTFRTGPTRDALPSSSKAVESLSQVNENIEDAELVIDADSLDMYTAPGTVGGAVSSAAELGMSVEEATSLINMDTPRDVDALTAEEGGKPGCRSLSDIGNGRRIVDAFGTVIRYTPGLGWFTWSGTHWRNDKENLTIREQAKKIAPLVGSEVVHYTDKDEIMRLTKWADQSRSMARINAAVDSAKTDPRIGVGVAQWDADPELIGVNNGVVNLRTGELVAGRPDLNITKIAPVTYTPGAYSSRWTEFIDFATNGDKEFQDWLQRLAGYTLTGKNHLDYMYLVYGPPGSGKNTFVEALVKCLGTKEYSWALDSEILGEEKNSNTVEYHWAQLVGKRMVWADELPEGEKLKENQIKKLTGASDIPARSPGESPFNFTSQAKLWITTNHRPMIVDDAMWRRIRPIPWSNVPEIPDPGLKEYLFDPEGGLPAVFAWMVEGAVKFLNSKEKDALGWCAAVYEAAEVYRQSEDRIGLFFEERMDYDPAGTAKLPDVHSSYQSWCRERSEMPLAYGKFERRLRDRGYNFEGKSSHAVLKGYRVMPIVPRSADASIASYLEDFGS